MVTIIDYGMGNLRSVQKACEFLGEECLITGEAKLVAKADKLILPGVGAFGQAVECLRQNGLDEAVIASARGGTPLLGICLGMQLLFETSYEGGAFTGLGLIPGTITRFGGNINALIWAGTALRLWKAGCLTVFGRESMYILCIPTVRRRCLKNGPLPFAHTEVSLPVQLL